MKISYLIIVYNGDFVLRQLLESIYPHAHAICIAEGTVGYFRDKGILTSSDDTNKILAEFPDPEKKIHVTHGNWPEKDEMCRAAFRFVPPDTDYVWCQDADELFTDANIEKVKQYLEKEQPTKLGFKSDTFFGGFENIMGSFERDHNFQRVLRYEPGCSYLKHRQPTLAVNGKEITGKDVNGNTLFAETGVTMFHASYVAPDAVRSKINYYEKAVIKPGGCIPNYFENVFLQWVLWPEKRAEIEAEWHGVHEFIPKSRGDCYTMPFTGILPEVIIRDMPQLLEKFNAQLEKYK